MRRVLDRRAGRSTDATRRSEGTTELARTAAGRIQPSSRHHEGGHCTQDTREQAFFFKGPQALRDKC